MAAKPDNIVWVAPLVRTLFETINPCWAYCEAAGRTPERVVLLHDVEALREMETAAGAFSIVSDAFGKKNGPIGDHRF